MRPRGNIRDIYPLTPMQEGMLFHALHDRSSSAYFEQQAYRLNGTMDRELVRKSLNELFRRHDVLRTAFILENVERPLQVVLRDREVEFFYQDISHLTSPGEQHAFIAEFREKDRQRSFDLSKDILMRVGVLQLGPEEFEFVWSYHHILMDGWCGGILISEFMEIYSSYLENRVYQLPPVKPFRTFITWLEKQDREKSKNYWKKYLEDYEGAVKVPIMNDSGKSGDGYKSELFIFPFGREKGEQLGHLAGRNRVTLNIIFQTVWGIILGKGNGKNDVVFGTVVSGRPSEIKGVESMIGLFVNAIPIRINFNGESPFNELIRAVQRKAVDSQDYHYYSLADIQSETGLKQDLIDHLMIYENYPLAEQIDGLLGENHKNGKGLGLRLSRVDVYEETNYDFNLVVVPGDELFLKFIFNGSRFPEKGIKRVARHFGHVLDQILENEGALIEDLILVTEEEKRQILYEFNDVGAGCPPGQTIHLLFAEEAVKRPDNVALTWENRCLTYNELNGRANRLARVLRSRGVKPDSLVGIMLDRSFDLIIALLSALKAGGACLPIETDFPQQRVLSILNDSGASLLLSGEEIIRDINFSQLENLRPGAAEPFLTRPRDQIEDLDQLPIPDRSLVDYGKIHQNMGWAAARHTISLQGSRGCPFDCAYCHKIWPKSQVVRSAEHILDEIQRCYDAGARRFSFIDDVFNLDQENFVRLLELIIGRGLDIQLFFPNGMRGDVLTAEIIDLMVQAGTVELALGLESASPRIQQLIRRNLNLERFTQNIRYITEKYPQVILKLEMTIGFPTETEQEALGTLDFLKGLRWVHFPDLHILKIDRNTDMYRLAVENGVSPGAIDASLTLGYRELPDTLPFSRSFVRQYQARFMNEYILSKERLLHVLPYQMKILTADELVEKYNSYLPIEINNFADILQHFKISERELKGAVPMLTDSMAAPHFCREIKKSFPKTEPADDAFRILLLDLSQFFIEESKKMPGEVMEEPPGLMILMTYLNQAFGERIAGKIIQSRLDFEDYDELRELIADFNPHLIGIRALTFYKEFFHRTVSVMRESGVDVPIIAGGPYATGDYNLVLMDHHIDLAVLGEGELTLAELVEKMMENGNKLPDEDVLREIAGIAFVGHRDRAGLQALNRRIVLLDRLSAELTAQSPGSLENVNKDGDLVYALYTSGSTGTPKGVMLEHRNLVNLIRHQYDHTHIDFRTVLQFTTINFDVSFQEIFSTLLAGGRLSLISREIQRDIPQLFEVIRRNEIKTLFLPASFLKFIFNEDAYADTFPPGVNHIVTAGEQIIVTEKFRKYLKANNVYLHNHYGPTETHVATALTLDPRGEIPALPSIGKPVAHTWIYILDRKMNLLPIGVAGELYIGGMQVGRGYLKSENMTGERFLGDPYAAGERVYKTGDLARWLEDGDIEFLGRIDHQVKIRGFRVELGEIESLLLDIEGIKKAVAVAREDEGGQKSLCAYVVSDREVDFSDIKDNLSRNLPDYMVPVYFSRIEEIPLTSRGKIDYRALPDPRGMVDLGKKYRPPQNEVEQKIIDIWADVLGLDAGKIGRDADFFELGGNSLSILKVISRISKIFGHNISMSSLFLYTRVEELAANIHEETLLNNLECIVKLNRSQREKNIFIVHPLHGMIYPYKELAGLLEDHANVFGIQARGLHSQSAFPNDMEIMVADYTHQLKSVQPRGPYILAGYCFGGMLAYDIVKLLEDMNDVVEKLILFDHPSFIPAFVFQYYRRRQRMKNLLKPFNRVLSVFSGKAGQNPRLSAYESIVKDIQGRENERKQGAKILPEESENLKIKIKFYMRKLMAAYYRKPPIDRHAGIIRADILDIKPEASRSPLFNIEALKNMTHGEVVLEGCSGERDSMFQRPHVEDVARIIKSFL